MSEPRFYTDSFGNKHRLDETTGVDALTYGRSVRRTWMAILLAPVLFVGLCGACIFAYMKFAGEDEESKQESDSTVSAVQPTAEEPNWFERTWAKIKKATGTSVDDEDLDDMLDMRSSKAGGESAGTGPSSADLGEEPHGDDALAVAPPIAPPTPGRETRVVTPSPRVQPGTTDSGLTLARIEADKAERRKRAEIAKYERKVEKLERELRDASKEVAQARGEIEDREWDLEEAKQDLTDARTREAVEDDMRADEKAYRKRFGDHRRHLSTRRSPRLRERDMANLEAAVADARAAISDARADLREAEDDRRRVERELAHARDMLAIARGTTRQAEAPRRR